MVNIQTIDLHNNLFEEGQDNDPHITRTNTYEKKRKKKYLGATLKRLP